MDQEMKTENNGGDVEFLESYLNEHPESILFARLADVYLHQDRVDQAIQVCEEGIKKHPYYATGHFVLGKSYMAKKLFEQAEKEFKRVLLFDPKFLAAHKLYGDLMKEIGWENTCEMSYKKILQIDPLDEHARSVVGEYILEGEQRSESKAASGASMPDDTSARPESESGAGVDLDAVSPISVSAEEEDMLFDETEVSTEEVIKAQAPAETKEATGIDDAEAEEFSFILDDIFKDEVVEGGTEKKPSAPESTETSTENGAANEEPDPFLADLQMPPETAYQPPAKPEIRQVSEPPAEPEPDPFEDIFKEPLSGPGPESQAKPVPPEPYPQSPPVPTKKKKGDKIVTPTLGEIYAAQGQYSKALDVFETLIKKHPDNEFYIQKIAMLKQKLAESRDEAKN